MSKTPTDIQVQQSRDFRYQLREIMNETARGERVTVVSRYAKPECVLIPYDWLVQARNGDFVQLVHQIRTAVENSGK